MHVIPVETLDDPRVHVYANMRDAELAQRRDPLDEAAHAGVFIAEGELVLRRLAASRFKVQSVLTTPTRLESIRDALERLPPGTPVYVVEQGVMDGIVGFSMHRGVLAIGERGAGLSVDDILKKPGPIVVLEDVNNHDNLGGIFRNVAALGGAGASVLLSPRCVDPLYRKALRVSIGCALSVEYARAERWPGALEQVRRAGVVVLGMTPNEPSEDLMRVAGDAALAGCRIAILLGAEGPGLTPEALASCDRRVRIEMDKAAAEVDSLNVHVAAGMALHQLWTVRRTRAEVG